MQIPGIIRTRWIPEFDRQHGGAGDEESHVPFKLGYAGRAARGLDSGGLFDSWRPERDVPSVEPMPPDSSSHPRRPPELSVEEIAEWIDGGQSFRLIDVREPWEREIVSLQTAEPLDEELVERLLRSGDLDQNLVFMCHHGIRSLNAAAFFAAQGFNHVYSMSGGIAAWAERIDPVLPQY